MKFIVSVVKSFFKNDCHTMAENIAFCSLLAMIPMGMIIVSLLGYFIGGSEDAFRGVVEIVTDVLPFGREQFVNNLQLLLKQRSSFSLYGIIFLVFVSTLVLASIERALNVVFNAEKRRIFIHSRLMGVVIIVGITLLFSLPTAARIFEGIFAQAGFHLPLSWLMTGKSYFILVSFLAYVITVVAVPNQRVYVRYAAVGGILFSLGLAAARFAFRWYLVTAIERYNLIYGSLTAVVLMIMWIYYLSIVFLFSAELVAGLQFKGVFHRRRIAS